MEDVIKKKTLRNIVKDIHCKKCLFLLQKIIYEVIFMENLKGIFCGVVGVAGGIVINLLGGWDNALAALFICIILDYLTGLAVAGVFKKSPKTKNGALESRAGLKGLIRKIVMIFFVGLANTLDNLIGTDYIRYTVIIGFICNEVISLIENAGLMGVPVPDVIKNAVDVLKGKEDR